MKTQYTCEKCDATYDNWEAAYECEKSHIIPSVGTEGFITEGLEYKECSPFPYTITLRGAEKTDEDGNKYFEDFARYDLYGILPADKRDELNRQYKVASEKSRIWWAEYEAKRAAEKAAEKE